MSDVSSVSEASFCESVEAAHSSHDDSAQIASLLGMTKPSLRMDSQCKYCSVSRGDADIYLRLPTRADYEENIWVYTLFIYKCNEIILIELMLELHNRIMHLDLF